MRGGGGAAPEDFLLLAAASTGGGGVPIAFAGALHARLPERQRTLGQLCAAPGRTIAIV
jgi:hypothetical protein